MITRRGFLKSILAAATAPYLVRAEALMPAARPLRWTAAEVVRSFDFPRITLPILHAEVTHHPNFVDVTSLCDRARAYSMGIVREEVNVDLQLPEFPQNFPAAGVWLNGRLIPLDDLAEEVSFSFSGRRGGVLRLKGATPEVAKALKWPKPAWSAEQGRLRRRHESPFEIEVQERP